MFSRLGIVAVVVCLGAVGAGCGGDGSSKEPSSVTTTTDVTTGGATEPRRPVIVDLDVDHVPETQLAAADVAGQRARIQAAIDEVLRDLGDHGQLFANLIETAQVVVSVDAEGERILAGNDLVAAVNENIAQPPDTTPTSDVAPLPPVGGSTVPAAD